MISSGRYLGLVASQQASQISAPVEDADDDDLGFLNHEGDRYAFAPRERAQAWAEIVTGRTAVGKVGQRRDVIDDASTNLDAMSVSAAAEMYLCRLSS